MSPQCAVGPCQEPRVANTSYCSAHGPLRETQVRSGGERSVGGLEQGLAERRQDAAEASREEEATRRHLAAAESVLRTTFSSLLHEAVALLSAGAPTTPLFARHHGSTPTRRTVMQAGTPGLARVAFGDRLNSRTYVRPTDPHEAGWVLSSGRSDWFVDAGLLPTGRLVALHDVTAGRFSRSRAGYCTCRGDLEVLFCPGTATSWRGHEPHLHRPHYDSDTGSAHCGDEPLSEWLLEAVELALNKSE
jgi:hypothetical protein